MSFNNKEKRQKSLLNKVGFWIFIFGLVMFIIGLVLLFSAVNFSFGMIVASIVINVIGITLITTKNQAT